MDEETKSFIREKAISIKPFPLFYCECLAAMCDQQGKDRLSEVKNWAKGKAG